MNESLDSLISSSPSTLTSEFPSFSSFISENDGKDENTSSVESAENSKKIVDFNLQLLKPLPGEERRLRFLRESKIFDSEPEESFDRLTTLAARRFKFPISVISFMDKDRHFFKSRFGLSVSSAPRHLSFCTFTYIDESAEIFVVEDTHAVPSLRDAYMVQNPPYIRFYAGASIFIDNVKVGSLCVIDHIARKFDEDQQSLLMQMAACIGDLLRYRHEEQCALNKKIIMAHQSALLEMHLPLAEVNLEIQRLHRALHTFSRHHCPGSPQWYRPRKTSSTSKGFDFAYDLSRIQTSASSLSRSISRLSTVTNEAIHHLEASLSGDVYSLAAK